MTDQEFLTVEEFAAGLRVSKMTIYRLVQSGEIKSIKVGARTLRIPRSEWDRVSAG